MESLNNIIQWAKETAEYLIEDGINENFYQYQANRVVREWLSDNGLALHSGATKICVVSENYDWVIKFGMHHEDEEFCMAEVKNYEDAIDAGLDNFFVPTLEVEDYMGHLIYIQQKVVTDIDAVSSNFYNYASDKIDRADYENEDEYMAAVEDCVMDMTDEDQIHAVIGYGIEEDRLVDFCDSHEINDLHSGNWGRLDGEYVLIDFSGYH